jgi:hypothetical protein
MEFTMGIAPLAGKREVWEGTEGPVVLRVEGPEAEVQAGSLD